MFQNRQSAAGYEARVCRRPIKMSPLCQLEMTLPGGFPGGVRGDGSVDERWGAVAAPPLDSINGNGGLVL